MIVCKNCGYKNLRRAHTCKKCGKPVQEKNIPSTLVEKKNKISAPNTILKREKEEYIPNTIVTDNRAKEIPPTLSYNQNQNQNEEEDDDDLFDKILPPEEDIFVKYNDILSPIFNEHDDNSTRKDSSKKVVICSYCRAENVLLSKACQVCNNPLDKENELIKCGRLQEHLAKIIKQSPHGEKVYSLQAQETIIGRDGGNILFPESRYVSQKHTKIYYYRNKIVIADLGSINGTYLKLRKPYLLQDGDIFSIGKQIFQFRLINKSQNAFVSKKKTEPFFLSDTVPQAKIVYFMRNGGYDISILQSKLIIGKEAGHIMLQTDESLSSPHVSVFFYKNGYILQDMDSKNGTWIRITKPSILKHGDMFRVGEYIFSLDFQTN